MRQKGQQQNQFFWQDSPVESPSKKSNNSSNDTARLSFSKEDVKLTDEKHSVQKNRKLYLGSPQ